MKNMNLTLFATAVALSVGANATAKGLPVCTKLQKDADISKATFQEYLNKADRLATKRNACKAARAYQMVLLKDQKLAFDSNVDLKLLKELNRGKYLNDYVAFALELKKISPNNANNEEIDFMLADTYNKNLPKSTTNIPIGNFVNTDGSASDIVTEAIMVQEDFLTKYPTSNRSNKIKEQLEASLEVSIRKSIEDFKYELRLNKKSQNEDIYEYHAANLVTKIKEDASKDSKTKAFYELFKMYKENNSISDANARISELAYLLNEQSEYSKESKNISKYIKSKGLSTSEIKHNDFLETVYDSSEIMKQKLSSNDLKDLIKEKKGKDKSIFMPIEFTSDEKAMMLRTLGVVGIMMAFDQPLMDFVQDNKSTTMDTVTDFTNSFGEDTGIVPLVGASMAVGLVFKNDKLKRAAVRSVGALILGQTVTQVIKTLTSRERPSEDLGAYKFNGPRFGRNNTSFSSGHSAGAWSVMTVFATEFKDTKIVPVAAYSLAALSSFARVYKKRHWFSDVTMGALIGWASGKIMYKLFDKKKDSSVTFTPVTGDMNGGALTYKVNGQKNLKAWPKDYYQVVFNSNQKK